LSWLFLYDVFFTSNVFLHSHQEVASTTWALASFIGICFVGVAVLNPGTTSASGGGTILLDTTAADLIITLVVLGSLALLQVLQVVRCWTSNWERVDFVCDYIRNKEKNLIRRMNPCMLSRALLIRMSCFHGHLWQNKLGQYSFVESISMSEWNLSWLYQWRLSVIFGLPILGRLLREMWGRETGYTIELHPEVKEAVAQFIDRNGRCARSDVSALC
jgi:hypothetical protein